MPSAAEARFSGVCRELERIADINRAGIACCVGTYQDCPDEETGQLLAQSLALGLAQIAHLGREIVLLALDLEERAAKQLS